MNKRKLILTAFIAFVIGGEVGMRLELKRLKDRQVKDEVLDQFREILIDSTDGDIEIWWNYD